LLGHRYLWRAVDDEGEVLDVLVQRQRNKHAASKLLRKLLKNRGVHPETITTDKLASYRAALRDLGLTERYRPGGMRENNRVENSGGGFHRAVSIGLPKPSPPCALIDKIFEGKPSQDRLTFHNN